MAQHSMFVDLNLNGNQIKNVVVDNVSALPAGTAGQIVFYTGDNLFYYFNGTTWIAGADVSITSSTTALVVTETSPSVFTLSIANANATDAGLLTAAFYTLLNNATTLATMDTLVKRNLVDGGFAAGTIDVLAHDPTTSAGITGLSTPLADTDAANKAYVDSIAAGLSWKAPGTVVSTAQLVLSGLGMLIDGVPVTAGMKVLATNQGNDGGLPNIDNGWYIAEVGAWTRWSVYGTGKAIGSFASFVQKGTTYGDTAWVCTNDTGADVVGTDALGFVIFSATGGYSAGAGIKQTGNVFSIASTANTLTPSTGNLEVKVDPAGAISQGTGSGIAAKVDSSTIPTTRIVSNEIRTGLAVPRMVKSSQVVGTVAGPKVITHNLNTQDVIVQVYNAANNLITISAQATSLNTVTVAANGANQTVKVVISAAEAFNV